MKEKWNPIFLFLDNSTSRNAFLSYTFPRKITIAAKLSMSMCVLGTPVFTSFHLNFESIQHVFKYIQCFFDFNCYIFQVPYIALCTYKPYMPHYHLLSRRNSRTSLKFTKYKTESCQKSTEYLKLGKKS